MGSRCGIVASVAVKTGTAISYAMGAVSLITNGGSSNLRERPSCKLAYAVCPLQHGGTFASRHVSAIGSNSIAFVSVIGHWSLLLHWKCGGNKLTVQAYCPHSLKKPVEPFSCRIHVVLLELFWIVRTRFSIISPITSVDKDYMRGGKHIMPEPANPTPLSAATADINLPGIASHRPTTEKIPFHRRKRWRSRTFQFSLSSIRLGGNLSLRRFSVTEWALLLMMAYLTSKGLGVIRQSLFNALIDTGTEATAYFAAFTLPDTLFSLIAEGALSSAFIPVFIGKKQRQGEREICRLASW